MTEALTIRETESAALMPVMSIETATERYKTIVEYVKNLMHEGSDFGKIPGTDKNTLLKPGAEKLCTLFGLSKRFTLVEHIEDWLGNQFGEPFFNYLYRCALYRGDALIAEADGSCNSMESKYRWRDAKRLCPGCNQPAVFQSKNEDGFYCWSKRGGCGAKFGPTDSRITEQKLGRIPNPDIADQVNTLQKMAQKRALIAATLLAVNASEFFTQDMEDFIDVTAKPAEEKPDTHKAAANQVKEIFNEAEKGKTRRTNPTADNVRRTMVKAVADAFKMLNQKGDSVNWTPKTANSFVAEKFQGVADVDHLDDGQLNDLLKLLSDRLDGLKNGSSKRADIVAVIRSYFDSETHEDNYLKEHYEGKTMDQLSIGELEQLEKTVSIPF